MEHREVQIVQVLQNSASTKVLTLADIGGRPFRYTAGQFCLLAAAGQEERPFTFGSSPVHPQTVEIAVKQVGPISDRLHSLPEGAVLQMKYPYDQPFCAIVDSDEPVLLMAGGSGITPFISLLRYLADQQRQRDAVLLYSSRYRDDIVYFHELERLASQLPSVRVVHTLTRGSNHDWQGERGRIDRPMILRQAADYRRRQCCVCGPMEMMRVLSQLLMDMKLPEDQLLLAEG